MTDHRTRRWFQLSLKSLFLLTLLVATFFAGYALRGKQEKAARQRAKEEAEAELQYGIWKAFDRWADTAPEKTE